MRDALATLNHLVENFNPATATHSDKMELVEGIRSMSGEMSAFQEEVQNVLSELEGVAGLEDDDITLGAHHVSDWDEALDAIADKVEEALNPDEE